MLYIYIGKWTPQLKTVCISLSHDNLGKCMIPNIFLLAMIDSRAD